MPFTAMSALVMELEGDDLSQRLARGAIPLDEALLLIAKQIAEALGGARAVHHPSRSQRANITVRSDGMVEVFDLGLAKAMEPSGAMSARLSPGHC